MFIPHTFILPSPMSSSLLEEITKQRFIMYVEELKWARKIVEMGDGRIKLRNVYETEKNRVVLRSNQIKGRKEKNKKTSCK